MTWRSAFIMAGRDTTSSALTWFFWLLRTAPPRRTSSGREVLREVAGSGAGHQAAGG
jgi:cytochrome P450